MQNTLRSAILKQKISKGILWCKHGRSVQMTFGSKRNYQEVIKDIQLVVGRLAERATLVLQNWPTGSGNQWLLGEIITRWFKYDWD